MNLYDSRILIVDDEKALSRMVEGVLQKEGFSHIYTAADCKSAELLTAENEFQMILLDVMLPDGDGFSLYKVMRETEKNRNTPVIFLSARDEDYARLKGLGLGADDYITKPFHPAEVCARVKSQLRRYMQLGAGKQVQDVLSCGGITLDDRQKQVLLDGEEVSLTPTEYEILKLLMQNQGSVFSPKEIYRKIWNDLPYGSENTVAVHIRHIREKLEINPAEPRYLKVVWGQGYKCENLRQEKR